MNIVKKEKLFLIWLLFFAPKRVRDKNFRDKTGKTHGIKLSKKPPNNAKRINPKFNFALLMSNTDEDEIFFSKR